MIRSVPIYDYRCDVCGHAFSAVRSYSEGPVETCPQCGKRPRRLITAPAVVFKGSGWYKTDSRGAAPKEGGDSPTPAASSDPTSDAKAAPKREGVKEARGEPKRQGAKEPKSETKSETKSEAKSEAKKEAAPSPAASAKSEAKS